MQLSPIRNSREPMKIFFALAVVTACTLGNAQAAERTAKEVTAADGVIKCITAESGWLFSSSGLCKDFEPPQRIAVGETFKANGEVIQIGVITVRELKKDIKWGDIEIKKGTKCSAARSLSDLPNGKDDHEGTWLHIADCAVIE